MEHFECHGTVVLALARQVHRGGAAPTELALDGVAIGQRGGERAARRDGTPDGRTLADTAVSRFLTQPLLQHRDLRIGAGAEVFCEQLRVGVGVAQRSGAVSRRDQCLHESVRVS